MIWNSKKEKKIIRTLLVLEKEAQKLVEAIEGTPYMLGVNGPPVLSTRRWRYNSRVKLFKARIKDAQKAGRLLKQARRLLLRATSIDTGISR